MTSKNLFFRLLKENTKQRLWSVALISLVFFFTFPVQTALRISNIMRPETFDKTIDEALALEMARKQLADYFTDWCSMENGLLIALMFVFALICGVSGFSYLHSRKKTDFYHSIPVRRELLFAAVCTNGVLYVAVPYFITMVISSVMIQVKAGSVFSWGPVFAGFLLHMAFYFLLYVTVIAAVILTGNTIVSILGALVFFLWGPGVTALIWNYFSGYFLTYYSSDFVERWLQRSSPAAWYIAASASEHPGRMALWALTAAAIILVLAVILYRKRPSEAAGHAMAFRVSQPIIKFLLAVPISLLGSFVFYSIRERDSWAVFGLICGLVISSCVIEIIFSFDFKRLFAHKRQLVLYGVFAAAILAFFRFDLAGYDSYLPSEEKVASVGIYCRQLDPSAGSDYHSRPELQETRSGGYRYVNWYYASNGEMIKDMYIADAADIRDVLAIGRQGVSDAAAKRRAKFEDHELYYGDESDGEVYQDVLIAYHLKNGKTVFRNYYTNLTAVSEFLDRVYTAEGYKEALYPVLSYEPEDIAGINYQEFRNYSHVALTDDTQKAALLEACQRELSALTAETRRKESPVAAIQFKTNEMQKMIDSLRETGGNFESFNHYYYYPIYPSFTETIRLLRQCGIEVGSYLTADKVDRIQLRYTGGVPSEKEIESMDRELVSRWENYEKGKGSWTVMITDKKEIEAILSSTTPDDLGQENLLNEMYTGIHVTAYMYHDPQAEEEEEELFGADAAAETVTEIAEREYAYAETEEENGGGYVPYELTFDYDKVPEFVKEKFGLTDAVMGADVRKAY